MEAFLGMIMPWPINFAPSGWAFCNGQLLSIQQNTALYALLGTAFGGDGVNNFALPDLRGRTVIGAGAGPGLTNRNFAEKAGAEGTTLSVNNLPAHTHTVPGQPACSGDPTTGTPGTTAVPSKIKSGLNYLNGYSTISDTTLKAGNPTGSTGSGQQVNNMQPYLSLNYIIALQGLFPTRD